MSPKPEPPVAGHEAVRQFTQEVDLAATPEQVWRALTEASEVERWFPVHAGVQPGEGGSVRWAWDGDWNWENEIVRWEPGRRLGLRQKETRPFDVTGEVVAAALAEPARITLEFTLEAQDGGGTRLRLVHSGFGRGAAWDDELDSISHGWRFELAGLGHYLAHHRGQERVFERATLSTPWPLTELWRRLVGDGGLLLEPSEPKVGERYQATLLGEPLRGLALAADPGRQLAGTVDELGAGVFRIDTWRAAGHTGAQIGLVSWRSEDRPRLAAFAARTRAWMQQVLAP